MAPSIHRAELTEKDHDMRHWIATASILMLLSTPVVAAAPARAQSEASNKPTIVLVHGAFSGSSSWNAVITDLTAAATP